MNIQKAKHSRVSAWICLGISILLLALYIVKSLTIAPDREVSPALLIVSMMLLVLGAIGLARAKQASR